MSGPKVVRVVSREELVRQGVLTLARLDQAVAQWREDCKSIGQLDQSDLNKVIARRNELEALFRLDRFEEFSQRANEEIGFLEGDANRRRVLYLEEKARENARRESGLQTARTLLSVLKNTSSAANEALLKSLELVTTGTVSNEEVDRLLAQGFKLLSPVDEKKLTQSQHNLAQRLVAAMGGESVEKWSAPPTPSDPRMEAVVRGITELRLHLQEPSLIADFEKRFETIKKVGGSEQRNLLLDSLHLDVNDARDRAIKRKTLEKEIKLLDAELIAFGQDANELRDKLKQALDMASSVVAETEFQAVRAGFSDLQKRRAAAERRSVILNGLAKLGYSVNEGMATALSKAGRVVIQKPDFPDYGVELLGSMDAERLQVRTVALSAVRDTNRDLDAEQRWCSDFTKLKNDLGEAGTQVVIERAMPVGTVPVKVVDSNNDEHTVHSGAQATPKIKANQRP